MSSRDPPVYVMPVATSGLYVDVGDLNPDLHACTADTDRAILPAQRTVLNVGFSSRTNLTSEFILGVLHTAGWRMLACLLPSEVKCSFRHLWSS